MLPCCALNFSTAGVAEVFMWLVIGCVIDPQGNILEDESGIEILSSSKGLSLEISEKQKVASSTEAEIDETRNGYKPVLLFRRLCFMGFTC